MPKPLCIHLTFNYITNICAFWDELHDFYCQHNTYNFDWTMFKNFMPLLGPKENTINIIQEVQQMPTLQQMITPSPPSTQLWPNLLLDVPMIMLTWDIFQSLIKPCKPIWMPSCRNYNQSSTKWTTAIHMQQQYTTDMAHHYPFILHLTYNKYSTTTPNSAPICTTLSSTIHATLK